MKRKVISSISTCLTAELWKKSVSPKQWVCKKEKCLTEHLLCFTSCCLFPLLHLCFSGFVQWNKGTTRKHHSQPGDVSDASEWRTERTEDQSKTLDRAEIFSSSEEPLLTRPQCFPSAGPHPDVFVSLSREAVKLNLFFGAESQRCFRPETEPISRRGNPQLTDSVPSDAFFVTHCL